MSIVDGKGLITWEGGLFEPNSDLLRRVQWAFAQIRADGGHIELNEAGRPFGVPGDMLVRNASQTASGVSTVWFQWGRYQRGETPSAANPNSGELESEHTQGLAIDCEAKDIYTATLRAKYFAQVGMKQTISSESWHWAIRSKPTVDLAGFNVSHLDNSTPGEKKEIDMTQGILFRNSDTGAVVLGNLATGLWVGVAQGYPARLAADGIIEQADPTQKPNVNVPANVFAWYESVVSAARAGTPSVEQISAAVWEQTIGNPDTVPGVTGKARTWLVNLARDVGKLLNAK